MDESSAAAFQLAGQDIPWLLRHWAGARPDKTFLISIGDRTVSGLISRDQLAPSSAGTS